MWNALGYGLLAFVFLVYGEYSRRGQAFRIMNAAAVFIMLQVSYLGLINLSAKSLTLLPLIYAAIILPIVVPLAIIVYNPRLRLPQLSLRAAAGGTP